MSDVVSIFSKGKQESYCIKCRDYVNKSSHNTCEKCDNQLYEVKPKESFEETMHKNMENKKRMEEDRKKANRNVIRSYRLKPRS